MNILTVFLQVLTILLALALGNSLAVQGVLSGRAVGGLNIRLGRWRVVVRTLQFRPTKLYYQAAILQAA